MPAYEIGFPNSAVQKHFEKELGDLDKKILFQVKEAINKLAVSPRPPGKKFKFLKPPIAVYHYVAHYRLRIGDYRILYDVDDESKKVILLTVRRRSEKTYR